MDYENLTPQYRIEEYLEAIVEGWAEATQYPYPDYPSWRIEEFLDAFITYIWEDGDHPRKPCPEPTWRIEECLRAIYDVMTGAATPWPFPLPTTNRIEEYLAAIHAYLADGTELPVPEPVWRIEQWLAYVLDAVKQGGGVETTVSGSPAHITNALAKAALSVLVSIEPIQDLHGYSSPWPAGGGVNKYSILIGADEFSNNVGGTHSNDNGTLVVTATTSTSSGVYSKSASTLVSTLLAMTGTITYSFDIKANISTNAKVGYETVGQTTVSVNTSWQRVTITSTVPSSTKLFTVYGTGTAATFYIKDFQLESGSPATAYAPYSNICPVTGRTGLSVYVSPTQDVADATTYAVDWTSQAGTVYGGTLDVVTGVLTVDRAIVTYSSSAGFEAHYSGRWYHNGLPSGADYSKRTQAINNCATYSDSENKYKPYFAFGATGVYVNKLTQSETIDEFDERLSANPMQICYYLATPLTYQLTAQEVQMLLGENYVWSSSGDTVSVTYYAEGNANPLQSLNILLGGNYSNPKTADDVSDKEALEIILGGNK